MNAFTELSNIEIQDLYRKYKENFGVIQEDEDWKKILEQYPDSSMKQIKVIVDMFEEITQRWIKTL